VPPTAPVPRDWKHIAPPRREDGRQNPLRREDWGWLFEHKCPPFHVPPKPFVADVVHAVGADLRKPQVHIPRGGRALAQNGVGRVDVKSKLEGAGRAVSGYKVALASGRAQ
jgi:hypothetical protein